MTFCGQTALFAMVIVVEVGGAVQVVPPPGDGLAGFELPDPPHAMAATIAATVAADINCGVRNQDSSLYLAR